MSIHSLECIIYPKKNVMTSVLLLLSGRRLYQYNEDDFTIQFYFWQALFKLQVYKLTKRSCYLTVSLCFRVICELNIHAGGKPARNKKLKSNYKLIYTTTNVQKQYIEPIHGSTDLTVWAWNKASKYGQCWIRPNEKKCGRYWIVFLIQKVFISVSFSIASY